MNKDKYPFEVKYCTAEENAERKKYFQGDAEVSIRVGPKGYFLPEKYLEEGPKILSMSLRPSDIFVMTYPRSGTTWTQEMVWLISNNVDIATASTVSLLTRFPFIEFSIFGNENNMNIIKDNSADPDILTKIGFTDKAGYKIVADIPSPRFIKTHLPLSLLPPTLLDTCKVVYVARDPRDVAVSFYFHNRLIKLHGYSGDFKTFWNLFLKDMQYWTPFFENNKEAWDKRDHPNMLFLFYEDLCKDLPAAVRKVAKFLDKELTEEQVTVISNYLTFDNFSKMKSVNYENLTGILFRTDEPRFIRKGKVNEWKNHFDEEMTLQAEQWIKENLRDTDFTFPHWNQEE